MGSGKSFFGVRQIVARLLAGEYVVTNVELYPDAPEKIARHYAPLSKRNQRDIADKCRRYYVYEAELEEAMRYQLPKVRKEARGLFVWDETHNDLNNRRYRERDQRDRELREVAGGYGLLEWATQLRKLGYVGFLLSQHHENTDAQLRRFCNHVIRLQNQREQTRLLGVRITPWPLFLAWWYPAHVPQNQGRISAIRTDRYFLNWQRHLYDTFGLYHTVGFQDEADDGFVIRLPEGGLPQAQPEKPAQESANLHLTIARNHARQTSAVDPASAARGDQHRGAHPRGVSPSSGGLGVMPPGKTAPAKPAPGLFGALGGGTNSRPTDKSGSASVGS